MNVQHTFARQLQTIASTIPSSILIVCCGHANKFGLCNFLCFFSFFLFFFAENQPSSFFTAKNPESQVAKVQQSWCGSGTQLEKSMLSSQPQKNTRTVEKKQAHPHRASSVLVAAPASQFCTLDFRDKGCASSLEISRFLPLQCKKQRRSKKEAKRTKNQN